MRFVEAARQNRDGAHWEGAVSNAILAAIHLASALCVRYLGVRSSSQDHDDAVELVENIRDIDPQLRDRFVHHLRSLLSIKGLAQYSSRAFEPSDADLALEHLKRALDAIRDVARNAGWP